MKIFSKTRTMWIKFPTKDMTPMIDPNKHNLTLKAENNEDEQLIMDLINALENYNSKKISSILKHIEEIQTY
mgnify:CR=1 FL=1